jgi:hypothetical protein
MLPAEGTIRELTHCQRKNTPVGSGVAKSVFFSASLAWPWSVLAMSDGVWKSIARERLIEAAKESRGEQLVVSLRGLARSARSGRRADELTVVLFEDDD